MIEKLATDVLVVGSGAAGLCAAISARRGGAETLVASFSTPGGGNATAVSGGIINAALSPDDSPQAHLEDTLRSGVFLNDRPLIARVVEMFPKHVPQLEELGVRFARNEGGYILTRSPGHTHARTLLFQPRVGVSLTKPLVETVKHLGAKILPNFTLVKVLVRDCRVTGAVGYLWETDQIVHVVARAIILATGGASLMYSRTRIPPGVPGDGYGIALDAGLVLQDMEFVQFYPTVLAEPEMPKVMIGYEHFLKAGARFINSLGEDIIDKHQLPEPEMITRDQLSIAVAREVYAGKGVHGAVLMDASRCESRLESALYGPSPFFKFVKERQAQGDNPLARPIRVSPANHYYMGGVQANADGETTIEGLFACGEVVGGTHGANRLQGNSLSETVVTGFASGRRAASLSARFAAPWADDQAVAETAKHLRTVLQRTSGTTVKEILSELQSIMTEKVALVRDGQGLQEAKAALIRLRGDIHRAVAETPKDRALLCTLPQLFDTAESIAVSAIARCESRGGHYRLDYPERNDGVGMKHVTCAKHDSEIVTSECAVRVE